ncbi:MAG TPA: hypothetical protein VGC12_07765 [Methyloradius sp.]
MIQRIDGSSSQAIKGDEINSGDTIPGAHVAQAGLSYVIGSGTYIVSGVAAFNKD